MIKLKIGVGHLDVLSKCENGHKNTPFNSIGVLFSNLIFSLIAVVHLAYLGASFDLSEEVRLEVLKSVNFLQLLIFFYIS